MQRRSNVVSGWVNFPVGEPGWKNTNEGGMVVKLVVCDNREFDAQFGVCCGASVTDILSEVFVGDDCRPKPLPLESYDSVEAVQAEQNAIRAWESYHFPRIGDDAAEGVSQYLSRDYLAALVIGTTGWSGWHEAEGRGWQCQFDDLTIEGKQLYRQLEALYPGCVLHLLTFLDT